MRAIDLYAGIGGWSLGLGLAGIEVVGSYEWWQPAIDTHNHNQGSAGTPVDIRKLDLGTLPSDIDLVVGSPPCTQFSYSNRGGNGDLADGLKDLVRFFEVVEALNPTYWVMENVPRVAEVLQRGFADPDHPLHRFRALKPTIKVLDMSMFGTPQARKRCIAGVLPFNLLEAYQARLTKRSLGDVITALATDVIEDPLWGVQLARSKVTEMEREVPLSAEELRMNSEAKLYHPIYNNMAFPDDPGLPSRTVTATCTRVSRESIVIEDPAAPGSYRRLTVRERACLQGFPITYQFFGRSFAEKAKMVGNAIPPSFTYLVACAASGVLAEELREHRSVGATLQLPPARPAVTQPNEEGRIYPEGRRFRAAIPGLRFKSGMRFELANHGGDGTRWHVRFLFGPSRDIREIDLDATLLSELESSTFIQGALATLRRRFADTERLLWSTGPETLQRAWTRRGDGPRPYDVCDELGVLAAGFHALLADAPSDVKHAIVGYVLEAAAEGEKRDEIRGAPKLAANALSILSGFVVGSWFNTLGWHQERREAA